MCDVNREIAISDTFFMKLVRQFNLMKKGFLLIIKGDLSEIETSIFLKRIKVK